MQDTQDLALDPSDKMSLTHLPPYMHMCGNHTDIICVHRVTDAIQQTNWLMAEYITFQMSTYLY